MDAKATANKKANKKSMPPAAVWVLPLAWQEHDVTFFIELFHNFNIKVVVHVFGSANIAIKALEAKPPCAYFGIGLNQDHVTYLESVVDEWLVREIGREAADNSY